MATHELKTWPEFYLALEKGRKTFEVRKDDRGFMVGDLLVLKEWDPRRELYTGREMHKEVSYRMPGGQFGIQPGYVVLGLY